MDMISTQHRREGRELELEARVDCRDVVDCEDRPELFLDPNGHVVHLALQKRADGAHVNRKVTSPALNGVTRK